VILSAPHYLQSTAKDRLLAVGTRLFDWLELRFAKATVQGAPIEYIVNQSPGHTLVTLVNNSATPWTGCIVLEFPAGVFSVREYVADTDASWSHSADTLCIKATTPPYDVRVYALETADSNGGSEHSNTSPHRIP
jgi:hypothetical protein